MSDTLRKLQDRREIEDLLFEYCDLVDGYECDAIARLFTEDCVYDFGPALGGERSGNERLARGAARTLANWKATSHHVSNIRVHFEGPDAARVQTSLYAWHEPHDPEEPHFEIWARYRDRFVRTPAGWRIAERRLVAAGQRGVDGPLARLARRETPTRSG